MYAWKALKSSEELHTDFPHGQLDSKIPQKGMNSREFLQTHYIYIYITIKTVYTYIFIKTKYTYTFTCMKADTHFS